MTWRDVDFNAGRIRVRSPKTARHQDKGEREVPLFRDVRDALLALMAERPPESQDDVLFSGKAQRAHKLLTRLCQKLDEEPYPRIVQNLRSSAAIDILRKYGAIAENAWLGHSTSVAQNHYWHVLEEDFQRAAQDEKRL